MATPRQYSFRLEGADGGPLCGEVRSAGGARPAVVVSHGFKGFKNWGMFPQLATRLSRAGFTAVTFNFSGSGVSPNSDSFAEPERFSHDTYSRQLFDLGQVLRALKEARLVPGLAKPTQTGLLGHSRGGGMSILATAADPEIAALVTWASISRPLRWSAEAIRQWRADGKMDVVNARTGEVLPLYPDILDDIEANPDRLDITAAAGRITVPWLIVHGAADESVAVDEARVLGRANPSARLFIVENAGHTFGARHPWQGATPELDQVFEATIEWFGKNLL